MLFMNIRLDNLHHLVMLCVAIALGDQINNNSVTQLSTKP